MTPARDELLFLLASAPTGVLRFADPGYLTREIALLEFDGVIESRIDDDKLWIWRAPGWEAARQEGRQMSDPGFEQWRQTIADEHLRRRLQASTLHRADDRGNVIPLPQRRTRIERLKWTIAIAFGILAAIYAGTRMVR